jgi:hypothetical protein
MANISPLNFANITSIISRLNSAQRPPSGQNSNPWLNLAARTDQGDLYRSDNLTDIFSVTTDSNSQNPRLTITRGVVEHTADPAYPPNPDRKIIQDITAKTRITRTVKKGSLTNANFQAIAIVAAANAFQESALRATGVISSIPSLSEEGIRKKIRAINSLTSEQRESFAPKEIDKTIAFLSAAAETAGVAYAPLPIRTLDIKAEILSTTHLSNAEKSEAIVERIQTAINQAKGGLFEARLTRRAAPLAAAMSEARLTERASKAKLPGDPHTSSNPKGLEA